MVLEWSIKKEMKKRIYLIESGKLERLDNSLVFINNKGYKTYLPIYQIESINIYGHCSFNKEVIQLLFLHQISLLIFSFSGKYLGSYRANHNQLGSCLINQVLCNTNQKLKNEYVKEIILTAITNMMSVLKYYNKKRLPLEDKIDKLQNIKEELINKEENFLISEALAKQVYYSAFNIIIKNKDFNFIKRTTHPSTDLINALMSFGYAVLYGIIENDIYQSNLVISLPFIHGITRNSTGLQYDIADIFKPILIDRLIFRLINKRQITKEHFIIKENETLLNKEGIKILLEEIEKNLQSVISVTNNKKMSYRSIIKQEAQKLEKSIKENKKYNGFLMRW